MKRILTIVFSFMTVYCFGQEKDTLFYDKNNNMVNSLDSAYYFGISQTDPTDLKKTIHRTYFKSGQIRSESESINDQIIGCQKIWHENGQLRREINFNQKSEYHGSLITYWENGQIKRKCIYKNGKLKEGKCFNIEGVEVKYFDLEKGPQFPGGNRKYFDFVQKELMYPENCVNNGIEGTVLVSFFINEDGSLTDIKIEKGIDRELNAEAYRLVMKMPNWEPFIFDGDTLGIKVTYPITFRIENNNR